MELHKRIKRDKALDDDDEPIRIAERQSHFPYVGTSTLLNKMVQDVKNKVSDYYQKNKDTFDSIEFVEQEILLNLDDGILVNGRIDLIRKKIYEGTYETTIIEFKSDDDPQSSKITLDQLKLYGLGHKELTGHKADYIQIYNIKTNKKESPHVLEDKHLEEMREKIQKAATEIRDQYFNRIDKKEICLDCLRWQICSSGIKFKK
jgi:DNA helicase-2/ATP-dependent DNA helicase PcrA